MSNSTWVHLTVFGATLVVFAWVAMRGRRSISSVAGFFHSPVPRKNLASLVASNITIGTGLGYLLVGGRQNGLAMLLAPVGVLIGYLVLERLTRREFVHVLSADHNFFVGADALISSARGGRPSRLSPLVLAPLLSVFLLLFAYELFVSSQVIAGLMFNDAGIRGEVVVVTALFLFSLVLTVRGGIHAVFETDTVQLVGIVGFLLALVAGVYFSEAPQPAERKVHVDLQVLATVLLALVSAVATQIYSLLNFQIVSNLDQAKKRRAVLRRASLLIAAMLAVVVAVGAMGGIAWERGLSSGISELFAPMQTHSLGRVVLGMLIIGGTSIVVSTADSLMLTLTMFTYENFLAGRSNQATDPRQEIGLARKLMTVLFLAAFSVLSVMYYLRPDVFFLLLAIGTGAAVFAPLIVVIGVMSGSPGRLEVLSPVVLACFTVLFFSAMGVGLWLSTTSPAAVPYVSLSFLTLSSALAAALAWISRSMRN